MSKSITTRLKQTPLAIRLLEVCESIPAIKFTEHNDEHDFDFVKASQLYEEFRRRLWSQKILLLSNESEISHVDFSDGFRETTIRIEFEITDCLNGEKIVKTQYGAGVSEARSGFGLFIAKTMGKKYFLREVAMIPWAEGDQEFQNRKRGGLPEMDARKLSKAERDTDTKERQWASARMKSPLNDIQIVTALVEKFDCNCHRDLFLSTRRADFDAAIAWLMSTARGDMVPALEDSVKIAEKAKSRKNVTSIGPQPVVPSAEMQREDEVVAGVGD